MTANNTQQSRPLAIVTGGASGLGYASAKTLIENGWQVCIFDLNEQSGQTAAIELGSEHCTYEKVDVCSAQSVEQGIENCVKNAATKQAVAHIRLLLNCAGIAPAKRTLDREGQAMPLDDFAKVININLIGSFNTSRVAAAAMAKNPVLDEDGNRGVIINTASVAAYDGQIGQTAYASSKAALVGLSLPMARDLAPVGIRVNAIAPGVMGTPMLLAMPDKVQEALAANVQHPKRLGFPEEFAKLVMHIVDNPYINGESIRLDGGLRMPPK